MGSKNDFNFMFEFEDDSSKSEFEDIVSDSSMKIGEDGTVSFSSFSGKGKYSKKPRGFAKWWKRRKTWQKASMITALSFVLIFSIVLGIFFSMFDYNYNKITTKPQDLGFENVLDKNIVNVALFGIDTRDTNSFKGNSDSIMILSLNTVTKKVKIISVLRDSFVPITYNGKKIYGKINSAYQRGGPELAIKTLNTVFGLDISEYATVNFYGMVDIIEAVGGIDAELTKAEVKKSDGTLHSINGCIDEICANLGVSTKDQHIYTAGKHHLNGIQAVAYSRIRYVSNIWGSSNDYGRTERQRYVMQQLFNAATTMEKSKYVALAKSLIPCSETSLSYSEIMGLAFDILLDSPSFEQAAMPKQEYLMTSPSGYGSVCYYDLEFAQKIIHAFIYDDITPEAYVEANGIDKNYWFTGGRRPSVSTSSSQGSSSNSSSGDDDASSNEDSSSEDLDTSSDDVSSEDSSSGDSSSGDSSSGDSSSGDNSSGDTSSGDGTDTSSSESANSSSTGSDSSSSTPTDTPINPPTSSEETSAQQARSRSKK